MTILKRALFGICITLTCCSDHGVRSKFSAEETSVLKKYASILSKYPDTSLVLNAFRYLKIDSTTFKSLLIENREGCQETLYRQEDLDSILYHDYSLRTVLVDFPLYLKLFSIRTEHIPRTKIYDYVHYKLESCIRYIQDSLQLRRKVPPQSYRKAMQRVLESHVAHGLIDTTGLNHVEIYLFRHPTIHREYLYFLRNDSVIYEDDALWYLSRYRDIIVNSGIDTTDIFPVKLNFNSDAKLVNIGTHRELSKGQLSLLETKIRSRANVFQVKLVNNKPLSFSFVLLTPHLNSTDDRKVNYP